jgi:hypothetical protein
MDKADCIYPDCQIGGAFLGTACEHSCEWESVAKRAARLRPPNDEELERMKLRAKELGLI